MLDLECFSWVNRALEEELAPVLIVATNRGITTIRGTNNRAPHGIPLDLLDRMVIIRTESYTHAEIRSILEIRLDPSCAEIRYILVIRLGPSCTEIRHILVIRLGPCLLQTAICIMC